MAATCANKGETCAMSLAQSRPLTCHTVLAARHAETYHILPSAWGQMPLLNMPHHAHHLQLMFALGNMPFETCACSAMLLFTCACGEPHTQQYPRAYSQSSFMPPEQVSLIHFKMECRGSHRRGLPPDVRVHCVCRHGRQDAARMCAPRAAEPRHTATEEPQHHGALDSSGCFQ